MSGKFDSRQSLAELISILKRYEKNENIELYGEDCYIEDVLFFLGKSIDVEEYGYDATSYRHFIAKKIAPFSQKIAKAVFERKLKWGG